MYRGVDGLKAGLEDLYMSEESFNRSGPFYRIFRNCFGGVDILEESLSSDLEDEDFDEKIYTFNLILSIDSLSRPYDSL